MSRLDVLGAVLRERSYQDQKWGDLKEHPHSVGEWLLIIEGELAEAKESWVKCLGDYETLDEIRQVAAVAIAALEQHGCPERTFPTMSNFQKPNLRVGVMTDEPGEDEA